MKRNHGHRAFFYPCFPLIQLPYQNPFHLASSNPEFLLSLSYFQKLAKFLIKFIKQLAPLLILEIKVSKAYI